MLPDKVAEQELKTQTCLVVRNERAATVPSANQHPRITYAFDLGGGIITFLAMTPQGLFGMALVDYYFLQGLNPFVRGVGDLLIFVSAEEGKRRMVRFFNEDNFKHLPDLNWRETLNPRNWSCAGMINGIATFVISGTFAGLAQISLAETARLLRSYRLSGFDSAAQVVSHELFQWPFILSAWIANLTGYPNMWWNAFSAIEKCFFSPLLETPRYRQSQEALAAKIETVRIYLKKQFEHPELGIGESHTLLSDSADLGQVLDLYSRMSEVNRARFQPPPKPWWQRIFYGMTEGAMTGLTFAGLYNFLGLGKAAASAISRAVRLPYDDLNCLLGPLSYITAMAMAVAVVPPTVGSVLDRLFQRNIPIHVLSRSADIWLMASTFLMCGLGGTPNMFQAFLDHEDMAMIFIAGVAACLLESRGYFILSESHAIARLDLQKKLANGVDARLAALVQNPPNPQNSSTPPIQRFETGCARMFTRMYGWLFKPENQRISPPEEKQPLLLERRLG